MKNYIVKSTNYRNFALTENDNELAELIYPKWYSFIATIKLPDGKLYKLEPKGFWDAIIELTTDDNVLLSFKLGWKGFIITLKNEESDSVFLLKNRGMINNRYVLLDTKEEELVVIKSDFNWSKFKLDYLIETSAAFENFKEKESLLLTIIHTINYQIAMTAGAA